MQHIDVILTCGCCWKQQTGFILHPDCTHPKCLAETSRIVPNPATQERAALAQGTLETAEEPNPPTRDVDPGWPLNTTGMLTCAHSN
jgi:hypothetical protein